MTYTTPMTTFTTSGVTPAEQEAIREIAEQALVERLSRAVIVGTTPKGRIITELVGQPGPGEIAWFGMQARRAA